ncbi:hypothetical protein EPR50_G00127800 [Perca flavescens]|uniref:Uncharacterized protein n=1 Tax=Perca flavescens TaxID=8167 RepID=A0A484CQF0_PERFV|nr:hypothetical protein EPR50_G00127800 [Perca flavescens]
MSSGGSQREVRTASQLPSRLFSPNERTHKAADKTGDKGLCGRLPVAFCCGETDALWTQWTLERRLNTILEKFKETTATLPLKKKSLGLVHGVVVFPVPCW